MTREESIAPAVRRNLAENESWLDLLIDETQLALRDGDMTTVRQIFDLFATNLARRYARDEAVLFPLVSAASVDTAPALRVLEEHHLALLAQMDALRHCLTEEADGEGAPARLEILRAALHAHLEAETNLLENALETTDDAFHRAAAAELRLV
jgi:hypothetical protein